MRASLMSACMHPPPGWLTCDKLRTSARIRIKEYSFCLARSVLACVLVTFATRFPHAYDGPDPKFKYAFATETARHSFVYPHLQHNRYPSSEANGRCIARGFPMTALLQTVQDTCRSNPGQDEGVKKREWRRRLPPPTHSRALHLCRHTDVLLRSMRLTCTRT